MERVTEPLREEHKELLPQIEALRAVADSIGEQSPELLATDIGGVYHFLRHDLIPHAEAEDRVMYPTVGRVMGAPQATATMSRDHVEVGRLTEELESLRWQLRAGGLTPSVARDLRRVLYGLYSLVRTHFAKEEEIYLPLLDAHLTPDEARQMFHAMEEAAEAARARVAWR